MLKDGGAYLSHVHTDAVNTSDKTHTCEKVDVKGLGSFEIVNSVQNV